MYKTQNIKGSLYFIFILKTYFKILPITEKKILKPSDRVTGIFHKYITRYNTIASQLITSIVGFVMKSKSRNRSANLLRDLVSEMRDFSSSDRARDWKLPTRIKNNSTSFTHLYVQYETIKIINKYQKHFYLEIDVYLMLLINSFDIGLELRFNEIKQIFWWKILKIVQHRCRNVYTGRCSKTIVICPKEWSILFLAYVYQNIQFSKKLCESINRKPKLTFPYMLDESIR